MNIIKTFRTTHRIAACVLAAVLLLPYSVRAVGIGEIESLSKLGKPLHLRVGLITSPSASINNACLSLVAPNPNAKDRESYITAAKLDIIKTDDGLQHIDLASDKPFNNAFAKIRLQLHCPGLGSIIREFVLLPDPEEYAVQPQVVAPEAPGETGGTAVTPSFPFGVAANTLNQAPANQTADNTQHATAAAAIVPAAKAAPTKAERAAKKRHHAAKKRHRATKKRHHAAKKRHRTSSAHAKPKIDQPEAYQLKLSNGPPSGTNNQKERELSLEQQKLLDADTQMARFLALQQQVKQLQDELAETRLKLAQLSNSPTIASAPASAVVAEAKPALPKPSVAANPPAAQSNPLLQRNVEIAGVVLVILFLLLGLRRYNRIKSQQAAAPLHNQSREAPIPAHAGTRSTTPPSSPAASQLPSAPVANIKTPAAIAPAPTKKASGGNAAALQPQSLNALNEADSIMEEAQLYAVHGHPQKAIEMMNELVTQQPRNVGAWLLLFSILSSLSNAKEFSRTAKKFLKRHQNSPEWPGIQALGRTLEPDNPLYIDGNAPISATSFMSNFMATKPRSSVGDILVEMGALSEEDMQDCLADFDPKQHGRFGGYLISRKAITHAQLDEALRQQQGLKSLSPDEMPTLEDMEKLLADFDPKRDGSIGDYLVARKALTPAQLEGFLQQQDMEPAPPTASSDNPGKGNSLNFDIDFNIAPADTEKDKPLDMELSPPTDKNKPLDFELGIPPSEEKPKDK